MTQEEKSLLESLVDAIVEITLITGEVQLIRPIILVDEPPTPDLFYLELNAEGTPIGTAGKSILLSEISSVRV
jgi:hypothetical protein